MEQAMTKAARMKLTAIRLGAKGQHLDLSPLAKAKAFSKFGKPSAGDVVEGMLSLKVERVWQEYALVKHPEGDMSIGLNGKLMAQLSI
jgi:hypothetical protein